jgi:hypothetical protein
MQKIFFITALSFVFATTVHAQSAAGFDVNKLTTDIVSKLTPSLGLTNDQQPQVTNAVTGYLTGKSKIIPLQSNNTVTYTQKQGNLFNSLKSKLTGILLQGQMNDFLALKPKTNDANNVLSQLFY